jgi:hypothetical protein
MLIVPLQAVPSQIVNVNLAQQAVTLNVYQKRTALYTDVLVGGVLLMGGIISENCNRLIRSLYLGFTGDFVYLDLQGNADPYYTGLGDRWQLAYLTPTDLGGAG